MRQTVTVSAKHRHIGLNLGNPLTAISKREQMVNL
jgi:hypothetical protein